PFALYLPNSTSKRFDERQRKLDKTILKTFVIERTKVILGTIIPLIITYLLYLLNGTNNWFDLPSSTFGLICVLLFTFNLLSFIIGVYFLKHNSGKSFVYTFSVIFIKLLLVFGLI